MVVAVVGGGDCWLSRQLGNNVPEHLLCVHDLDHCMGDALIAWLEL